MTPPFPLSNGYLTAMVEKTTGNLVSLKYHNLEARGSVSGMHPGYWEQNPARAARLTATVSIDPAGNGGERAEVSVTGVSEGKALEGGARTGGGTLCDLEIPYTLGRRRRSQADDPRRPTYQRHHLRLSAAGSGRPREPRQPGRTAGRISNPCAGGGTLGGRYHERRATIDTQASLD